MSNRKLKIISGSSNPVLAKNVCDNIPTECDSLVDAVVSKFADSESRIEIREDVRGCDVFVLQSTSKPANDYIIELCLILDALKRSNCWRITAVLPYFGYARQDRKIMPQVPISAKTIADLISISGAHRVVTIDLHSGQTQGFFNCPVDNLYAGPIFINKILSEHVPEDLVLVSPDAGGAMRARAVAKRIGCDMAVVYKRRGKAGQIDDMLLLGEVEGKVAIILDDMIDTAGTLCGASQVINDAGAVEINAYCTHAVLSKPSVTRIDESNFNKVYVTDTIPLNKYASASDKIDVISIDELLAQAILNIHTENGQCALFK